jgi:hypothetical protein
MRRRRPVLQPRGRNRMSPANGALAVLCRRLGVLAHGLPLVGLLRGCRSTATLWRLLIPLQYLVRRMYPAPAFAIWKSPGCRKVPGSFCVTLRVPPQGRMTFAAVAAHGGIRRHPCRVPSGRVHREACREVQAFAFRLDAQRSCTSSGLS